MDVFVLTLTADCDKVYYSDGYIDENLIGGYFLSDENIVDEDVSLFFNGETLTVKQSPHLMGFLYSKFNITLN